MRRQRCKTPHSWALKAVNVEPVWDLVRMTKACRAARIASNQRCNRTWNEARAASPVLSNVFDCSRPRVPAKILE